MYKNFERLPQAQIVNYYLALQAVSATHPQSIDLPRKSARVAGNWCKAIEEGKGSER